jgi:stage V sporulation protein B
MKNTHKIAGAVATVTVFGAFTRLISFLFKIYLSRALGAEALGLYQIALSVFFLFASLSSSGVPLVLSRKTAEYTALGKKGVFSMFTSALIFCTSISVVIALTLSLLGTKIEFLFSNPLACPLFLIMIPALVSTAVECVIRGWFWGDRQFTVFSATETIEETVRILFSVLFLCGVVGALSGVYAITWAFMISDLTVAVILFVIFFARGGKITRPSDIKEILFPSLPVTAMRVCSSLIGTLIAFMLPLRLVTFGMSGSEATASYGRIAGMANPLLFAPNAVIGSLGVVLIPEMSARMAKKDFAGLNKQLTLGINFSCVVCGFFIVAYCALGKEITLLLYNDTVSGEYLQAAAVAMIPSALTQMTQSALNSIGKEYNAFVNYLCGNIIMLSFIYFLPKFIGIYSVAAASFVCTTIIAIMNTVSLKHTTSLDASFVSYAFLSVLIAVPCAFLGEWLNSVLALWIGKYSAIPSAIVACAAYCVVCLVLNVLNVRGIVLQRFGLLKHRQRRNVLP